MTAPERPALIIVAHRILIGTAICFFAFYAVWEARAYREAREPSHAVVAIASAVITVGLGYYLKNLRRFVGR
jgi:hypothetical protein